MNLTLITSAAVKRRNDPKRKYEKEEVGTVLIPRHSNIT